MRFWLRLRQSTGWLYPYLVPTGHWLCRGLFRKIYVHNKQGVPTDSPVLLAANHPTAFVDPCVLCTYLDPPLYNMTRGDVFRKPFLRKLLESINMFPVYRARDGFLDRDRNDDVMEYCLNKLADRRVVTVYVEGMHHLEKRVRTVQKGIARIAFAAYERHPDPALQVVPVGCNYQYGDRSRDDVMVNVGQPLFIKDYWELYQTMPARATLQLCRDIEAALQVLCYHVANESDYDLAEQCLTLDRGDHPAKLLPAVQYENKRFLRERAIQEAINGLEPLQKGTLKARAQSYFNALSAHGLDDNALVNPEWASWWRVFLLTITFPAFVIGYMATYPIRWFATRTANQRVKKREFYTSALVAAGHLSGLVYYILLIIAGLCTGKWYWILAALSLPVWGWASLVYIDFAARFRDAWQALRHPERKSMLKMRQYMTEYAADLVTEPIVRP